ncbi:putative inorganic phosphate cotransporter [Lutzomyia longipalpis]|uniref:putative inorganic phosphate cotransporter n=1 Tax=Lutzomyia longipalpis TaxID=7200 RepID=UPI00248470F5|nr:putative inorganic phosphate cotransporter [Lutzomyia longipalpis]
MKERNNHDAEHQQQTDATERRMGLFKFDIGVRHYQSGLLFLLLLVGYALRVNMSVGIVAMVDNTTANPDFEEYNWNEQTQSLILSSFFWGYILVQLPAGTWARKFGAKILLSSSMGLCSLLTLLTPIAASSGGWVAVVVLRILLGVSQGFIFPCVHTLLAQWVPPSERSRLGTFVYAGSPLGNVLMLALSGVLASSSLGWPSIFYVSGVIGVIWTVLFFTFGSNSPEEDARITATERMFIQETLGQETNTEEIKKFTTPWKKIFTSLPFISLIVAHSAQNWGFWTLLTEIPTYMKNVLEMDIKKNALLSALPYLVMWLGSFVFSPISDYLINKGYLSVGNTRKLFNSIGLYFPMFALIGLGYVTKDHTEIAVFLLTFGVGINSGTYVGFMLNHMDLSPVYAGTLMGITNFSANIMSILGPLFVGLIVSDATNPVEWRVVFFVAAAIYFIGNTFFVIFGSGEIQPWNNPVRNNGDELESRDASKSTETVTTIK